MDQARLSNSQAADLRQAVVFAARFELFTQRFRLPNGYELQNATIANTGIPDSWRPIENPARVREYWADVLPPGTKSWDYPEHWCGALCLFCIHRAELGLDVFWRGGFAGHLRQLSPGELPQPGDLAYFKRAQHHAIVEDVDAAAHTFDSIDGNQQPGIVRHVRRPLASVAAFYSLDPLLEKAAA